MQHNQEILHVYEEESGQKINKEKTMFFFSIKKTMIALKDHVKATLNAQVTTQ